MCFLRHFALTTLPVDAELWLLPRHYYKTKKETVWFRLLPKLTQLACIWWATCRSTDIAQYSFYLFPLSLSLLDFLYLPVKDSESSLKGHLALNSTKHLSDCWRGPALLNSTIYFLHALVALFIKTREKWQPDLAEKKMMCLVPQPWAGFW